MEASSEGRAKSLARRSVDSVLNKVVGSSNSHKLIDPHPMRLTHYWSAERVSRKEPECPATRITT